MVRVTVCKGREYSFLLYTVKPYPGPQDTGLTWGGVMYHFPDRLRLFSAVAGTAVLPKRIRIPARSYLLRSLQKSKSRNADTIVINHPKTGGTWFRVMLSRLYQIHYDLPRRRIVKSDEFYNRNRTMPRFLVTNGYYTYESATRDVLDEIGQDSRGGKRVILLARNPCDVAVSWYLQFTKRTKAYKRELINSTLQNPVDRENISMWDFVMHPELGLPALIEYHNMWALRLTGTDGGLIIRYEDLRSEPVNTMSRVVEFLQEPFSKEEVEHAVEFGSFDNMRKLEKSGYFRNSSMALRNKKDPNTLKVRRGKVGGFRDYFTDEQAAIMEGMMYSRLSPVLGYQREARTGTDPVRAPGAG